MTSLLIKNEIPVLLTSSVIAHDRGVALKDTDERIRLALESIEQWLKIDPTLCLVLCDGSSYDFSTIVTERFPSSNIECLYFENDQELVKKYGRGFGEGEIVRYAVENSKSITVSGCFTKCTSKLWVENYKECLEEWNGNLLLKGVFENVFSIIKETKLSYIDTRFYITSTEFYKKFFQNAHNQVNVNSGHGLENCFFDNLVKYKINHALLKTPPVISGVGGGIGIYYKNSLKRRLKEILRSKIVQTKNKLKPLFI
jgi:hypothetical protein